MDIEKKQEIFSKIIEYVTYIFIFSFPFLNFRNFLYAGTSTRSASLIFFSTIIGIFFAIWLFKKNNSFVISRSPIFVVVSAYLIFTFISAIFGLNFHTSFWSLATRTSGLWYLLNLGFYLYILWFLIRDEERKRKLILVFITSSTLYSVLAFLGREGVGLLFKGYISDAFTFGNSTFAAMYLFAAFLLSIYYVIQAEKKKWWMFLIPILLLINPNFLNTGIGPDSIDGHLGEAKATTILLFVSVISLFFFWLISKIKNIQTRKKVTYSLFVIGIIGMFISAYSLFSSDGYLRKLYLKGSTAARPIMWEMSYKIIKQKPLLGWGRDNFERVFEENYDSRLLEERYGNEAWFDRAHNIFIDELIENGFIGLVLYILIYLITIWCLIHVSLNSLEKKDRISASILIVYFTLHFVELQTAFDTTISYPAFVFMLALAICLYDRNKKVREFTLVGWPKYTLAICTLIFFIWSCIWGFIPFVRAEMANGYIRTAGSSEKRLEAYPILLGNPLDTHSFLWRMSTDFQIGISKDPQVLNDQKKVEALRKEISFFENTYKEYLNRNPLNYRAHLNLADMLIYQRLLGVNKLNDAQKVLDKAIELVPQAPQAYWMKAVAYLYMGKFDLAKEWAKKGLDINPNAAQSQDVVEYINKSIKNFPEIDLYFFKQI
jgi:O-antigen ligase